MRKRVLGLAIALSLLVASHAARAERGVLDVGVAGHVFDHLGAIGEQAEAGAASGGNIVYATGFGGIGYSGLPAPQRLAEADARIRSYVRRAKAGGIRVVLGYVCATSIVKLEAFDANWPKELRARFSSPPADWLQVGRDGKALPSWYGGDYRPACMNHPDWRAYQKFVVGLQIESGHDGIFFDNPTVHPQGCYCGHCMKRFAEFLNVPADSVDSLRKLAAGRANDFMRYRCTIARDLLAEMRRHARTIDPAAVVTCNNSLNSPEVLFSQCRSMGYNVYELSRAQDWVVVEDMATLTRVRGDGAVVEYGPVYEILRAISHGKPVVAMTLAEGDYHTPANLTRLGMAEAAAHGASYLWWPTWPQNQRKRMAEAVRPGADLLRENARLLNGRERRADVVVFLPFRRWVERAECKVLAIARALSAANVQYRVVCEDDLVRVLEAAPPVLIVESPSVLLAPESVAVDKYKAGGGREIWAEGAGWLKDVGRRSVTMIEAPATVRAVVHDQSTGDSKRTVVHLLNLNVERVSSFEDKVRPASGVRLRVRVPMGVVRRVTAITADAGASSGDVRFTSEAEGGGRFVEMMVPAVSVSTILVIE